MVLPIAVSMLAAVLGAGLIMGLLPTPDGPTIQQAFAQIRDHLITLGVALLSAVVFGAGIITAILRRRQSDRDDDERGKHIAPPRDGLGRLVLLLGAVLALPTLAAAQTRPIARYAQSACTAPDPGPSFTCVNGQWLPPGHPGIPVAPPPPPVQPPTTPGSCTPFPDPYLYPAEARACVLASFTAPPPLPTFAVRQRYAKVRTYPEETPDEIIVLALFANIEGRASVGAQYTAGARAGDLLVFVIDENAAVWQAVP